MLPVLFDANFREKQLANVSALQLKPSEPSEPSEPSAMDVGCSEYNENGDGKPITTATISTLANDSAAAISTTTT
jgi:hypothetical protein